MSEFAIGYEDYALSGELTGGAAGEGQIGTLDLLRDMRLSKGCGFGDAGIIEFDLDWDEVRPLHLISLLKFHVWDDGEVTMRVGYKDESDATVWIIDEPEAPYQYPNAVFPWHDHIVIDGGVQARGVLLQISGTKFSLGRIWSGPLWLPPSGIEADWDASTIDPGEMQLSRGNQGYPRVRQRHRQFRRGKISHVPRPWAIGLPDDSILDLQQLGFILGKTEPCLLFPRLRLPGGALDTHAIHRLGCYGHFLEPLSPQHMGADEYEADVDFSELL